MLIVGMHGKGHVGLGGCTAEEYKTHFSVWCMYGSPLIIGCDIRNMDAGFPCNTGYGLKFRDLWAQEDAGVYRDTFCCMSCCPARPACLPGDGCKAVRWLSAKTAEESFLQMRSQLQSGSLTAAPPSFCALTASQSIFGAVAGLFWTGSVIIKAMGCSLFCSGEASSSSKK